MRLLTEASGVFDMESGGGGGGVCVCVGGGGGELDWPLFM